MLNTEKIRDPEKLRRVAVLLDQEVDRLQRQVRDLSFENARLRGESLAQIDFCFPSQALKKALEETETAPQPRAASPARPGHGPRPQEKLPVVETVHKLPEDKRDCKVCGGHLEAMTGQYEESEEVTVTERSYTLLVHRRQKYRCRCNGNDGARGPADELAGAVGSARSCRRAAAAHL